MALFKEDPYKRYIREQEAERLASLSPEEREKEAAENAVKKKRVRKNLRYIIGFSVIVWAAIIIALISQNI